MGWAWAGVLLAGAVPVALAWRANRRASLVHAAAWAAAAGAAGTGAAGADAAGSRGAGRGGRLRAGSLAVDGRGPPASHRLAGPGPGSGDAVVGVAGRGLAGGRQCV